MSRQGRTCHGLTLVVRSFGVLNPEGSVTAEADDLVCVVGFMRLVEA